MPATSKAQQRLFGMVHAYKSGRLKRAPKRVREIAEHISDEDAEHFAKTRHSGLPERRGGSEKAAFDVSEALGRLAKFAAKRRESYFEGEGEVESVTPSKTKGHDEIVFRDRDGNRYRISNNTKIGKVLNARIGDRIRAHGYRIGGTNVVHKVHLNVHGRGGWLERLGPDSGKDDDEKGDGVNGKSANEKSAQAALVGGMALGATIGAMVDRKRRARGALLGVLAGTGAGYAMEGFARSAAKRVMERRVLEDGRIRTRSGDEIQLKRHDTGDSVGAREAIEGVLLGNNVDVDVSRTGRPDVRVRTSSEHGDGRVTRYGAGPSERLPPGLYDTATGKRVEDIDTIRRIADGTFRPDRPVEYVVVGNHKIDIDNGDPNAPIRHVELGEGGRFSFDPDWKTPERRPPPERPETQPPPEPTVEGAVRALSSLDGGGASVQDKNSAIMHAVRGLDVPDLRRLYEALPGMHEAGRISDATLDNARRWLCNEAAHILGKGGYTRAQAETVAFHDNALISKAMDLIPLYNNGHRYDEGLHGTAPFDAQLSEKLDRVLDAYNRFADSTTEGQDRVDGVGAVTARILVRTARSHAARNVDSEIGRKRKAALLMPGGSLMNANGFEDPWVRMMMDDMGLTRDTAPTVNRSVTNEDGTVTVIAAPDVPKLERQYRETLIGRATRQYDGALRELDEMEMGMTGHGNAVDVDIRRAPTMGKSGASTRVVVYGSDGTPNEFDSINEAAVFIASKNTTHSNGVIVPSDTMTVNRAKTLLGERQKEINGMKVEYPSQSDEGQDEGSGSGLSGLASMFKSLTGSYAASSYGL